MSPLTVYAIGVLIMLIILNLTALPSVKSHIVIGLALIFPLTLAVVVWVRWKSATDPEFAEHVRELREEQER